MAKWYSYTRRTSELLNGDDPFRQGVWFVSIFLCYYPGSVHGMIHIFVTEDALGNLGHIFSVWIWSVLNGNSFWYLSCSAFCIFCNQSSFQRFHRSTTLSSIECVTLMFSLCSFLNNSFISLVFRMPRMDNAEQCRGWYRAVHSYAYTPPPVKALDDLPSKFLAFAHSRC